MGTGQPGMAMGRKWFFRVRPGVLCVILFLALPGGVAEAAKPRTKPPARPNGITHVVKAGETLFRISQAYEVKVASLLEANRLKASSGIKIGQKLFIPGARAVRRVEPFRSLSREERASLEETLRIEKPLPPVPPAEPPPTLPVEPSRPEPPRTRVRTDAEFVWPIEGPLNSPFGPRGGRLHTGIDIGSPYYQEVVAAADAEVLYAKDTRGPLGMAVVLQHGNGFRTVYAHLSVIIAREGDTVKQGQAIGGVGDTGRATGPHLHFEIRRNGVAVNPEEHLPATIDELVRDLSRPRPSAPAPSAPR